MNRVHRKIKINESIKKIKLMEKTTSGTSGTSPGGNVMDYLKDIKDKFKPSNLPTGGGAGGWAKYFANILTNPQPYSVPVGKKDTTNQTVFENYYEKKNLNLILEEDDSSTGRQLGAGVRKAGEKTISLPLTVMKHVLNMAKRHPHLATAIGTFLLTLHPGKAVAAYFESRASEKQGLGDKDIDGKPIVRKLKKNTDDEETGEEKGRRIARAMAEKLRPKSDAPTPVTGKYQPNQDILQKAVEEAKAKKASEEKRKAGEQGRLFDENFKLDSYFRLLKIQESLQFILERPSTAPSRPAPAPPGRPGPGEVPGGRPGPGEVPGGRPGEGRPGEGRPGEGRPGGTEPGKTDPKTEPGKTDPKTETDPKTGTEETKPPKERKKTGTGEKSGNKSETKRRFKEVVFLDTGIKASMTGEGSPTIPPGWRRYQSGAGVM